MLLTNVTTTALWHDVIQKAEASCAVDLKEEVESYLVFLLMRYTNKPELIKYIIAPDFLQGLKLPPKKREMVLQEVGDKCLLFAGLFPQMADSRLVKISYFVNLGQASYSTISKTNNDLYQSLASQFVSLMDILHSVRDANHADLLPLDAYDLWDETGSQRALQILKTYSTGLSIPINRKKD